MRTEHDSPLKHEITFMYNANTQMHRVSMTRVRDLCIVITQCVYHKTSLSQIHKLTAR